MVFIQRHFLRGRGLLIAGLTALMAGLIAACGGGDDPTATPTTSGSVPPTPTATAPVLPAWEVEWNETLEAAKQEGIVIVQNTRAAYREGVELAMEAFPDITIEAQVGRDSEERTIREYAAGIHAVDVNFTGASSVARQYIPAGIAGDTKAALFRPDVIDDDLWIGNLDDYFCDDLSGKKHIFCWWATVGSVQSYVNTHRADLATFTLDDLFEPENKGQWCMFTPLRGGSGIAWLTEIMLAEGKDYIRRLMATEPVHSADDRAMSAQIVNDEFVYCAGVPPVSSEFHREGVGLHVVVYQQAVPEIDPEFRSRVFATCCGTGTGSQDVTGGVYSRGQGGATLMLDPPNPNAAKILINWMTTRQGARDYLVGSAQDTRHCSIRKDLQDLCVSGPSMQPDTAYFDFITESTLWTRAEATVVAREILQGGGR